MIEKARRFLMVGVITMAALLALAPAAGWTFPIEIDPGAYVHGYSVNAGPAHTGPGVIDLPAGMHVLDTGAFMEIPGVAASWFLFTVDADGMIVSVENAVTDAPSSAAIGVGNRLVFRQAAITIEPGRFQEGYALQAAEPVLEGTQTVTLAPDLVYQIDEVATLGLPGAALGFYFVVDTNGRVRSLHNEHGASSGAASPVDAAIWFNN